MCYWHQRIIIINAFQKTLNELNCKPKKVWVNEGSEFYKKSMKSFLQNNDIETYSKYNEEKLVIAGRFIRALKNKIHKYITSVSKSVYIDKLGNILNRYNNTCHSTIKMKPVDVKSNTYIDSSKELNDKDPRCKISDIIRILKYKNIFAKVYTPNWCEEVFEIRKVKNTAR